MAQQQYRRSLVIVRRDLRLHDHKALAAACAASEAVQLAFIVDPQQLEAHRWQSRPGLAFMVDSLKSLHEALVAAGSALLVVQGAPESELERLLASGRFDAVYINRDYTPFARRRDAALDACCKAHGVPLHWHDDALLNAPGDLLTGSGTPYRVFTPFFRAASSSAVDEPVAFSQPQCLAAADQQTVAATEQMLASLDVDQSAVVAGRQGALAALEHLSGLSAYAEQRDIPALDATSHLSVHLKFGTLSVREAYFAIAQQLGREHALIRQLYWRDFFTHVAWFFPHVFGHAFDPRFDHIAWSQDESRFHAWCEGRTGFPIVDAGMRELAETGLMHNRLRMITASFLVKDLHISWRWGESWFARHLLDYDPALNNGNWQWAASTGCDAQPWFRIFNPWRQQQRFDADCRYIRRWLPKFATVDAGLTHQWHKRGDARLHPLPIVDHATQAAEAKAMFSRATKGAGNE